MTRPTLFLIPLLLSSAACSSPEEVEQSVGVDSSATKTAKAEQPAAEPMAFEKVEEQDGGTFEYGYSWPVQVSAEPALAARLTAERDEGLERERTTWLAALSDAPEDCVPCRNWGASKEFQVVADLPRFLSLSFDVYSYTGGAHGNFGKGALVWDREEDVALQTLDFFRSAQALGDAVRGRYCTALNVQRESKRGTPVDPASDDSFDICPTIDQLTVLLGSSNGQTFDRIGLVADPYVAGSYAEGYYEVTLPIDTAIIDAVGPAYADAFRVNARKTTR